MYQSTFVFQLFEATKFDLEDIVRNTTEKLRKDIVKFAETQDFLNNIDDTNKIFDYKEVRCLKLNLIQ